MSIAYRRYLPASLKFSNRYRTRAKVAISVGIGLLFGATLAPGQPALPLPTEGASLDEMVVVALVTLVLIATFFLAGFFGVGPAAARLAQGLWRRVQGAYRGRAAAQKREE